MWIQMWELNHKVDWVPKNWCLQTVMLEKTLESLWDGKEIKSVNPKGNQPWICIGRTDAEAEASILWPPDANSQLIGKDPNAGIDRIKRRSVRQRMRWLASITDSMDMILSKLQENWGTRKPGMLQSMGWQRIRQDLDSEKQDSVPTLWVAVSKTDRIPAIVKLHFSLGNRK